MPEGSQGVTGRLIIEDEVVAIITGVTTRGVKGVHSLGPGSVRRTLAEHIGAAEEKARGIDVEVKDQEANVNISVIATYSYSMPEMASEVRQKVAERLQNLCGIYAKEININIVGIHFPEEAKEAKPKQFADKEAKPLK
jgi:uncharacterized alkaline shock family protein YloU